MTKSRSLLDDITSVGQSLFSKESFVAPLHNPHPLANSSIISDSGNILVRSPKPMVESRDFISWIETYSGPKFSFIHCDFPPEHKPYYRLLNSFQKYSSKIASESSHLMFWFDMEFYEVTKASLTAAGFKINPRPLVWAKSRKARTVSKFAPQESCETAFLGSLGTRNLIRLRPDHYRSPAIASVSKPEPMLSYFFSMLIDETTDFFDPTADSGSAILAAKNCGARSILGLESPK